MNKKLLALGFAVLLLAISFPAHAQKEPVTHRMGILHAGTPPDVNADIFIYGLRQLGYSDGKNISIEHEFAQGKSDRLPELAKELAQLKVNAMFGRRSAGCSRSETSDEDKPDCLSHHD